MDLHDYMMHSCIFVYFIMNDLYMNFSTYIECFYLSSAQNTSQCRIIDLFAHTLMVEVVMEGVQYLAQAHTVKYCAIDIIDMKWKYSSVNK